MRCVRESSCSAGSQQSQQQQQQQQYMGWVSTYLWRVANKVCCMWTVIDRQCDVFHLAATTAAAAAAAVYGLVALVVG
jgi:hypothetical protein